MADDGKRPADDWGNTMAKKTFIGLVILAGLYVASVFIFILR